MRNILSGIGDSIAREIESPTKKAKYNRNHIFEDIKGVIRGQLSTTELMDINYHFNVYEKCLALSREGALELAAYWINLVDTMNAELSEAIRQPLQVLYHPMVAYFHYARKDYKKALASLGEEKRVAESFFREHEDLKMEYAMEQTVNFYRVFFAMQEPQELIRYGRAILLFATNGVETHGILEGNFQFLKDQHLQNAINWVNYTSDAVFSKLWTGVDNLVPRSGSDLLREIVQPLSQRHDWSACPIQEYPHAIRALTAFDEGDVTRQLQEVHALKDGLANVPRFLQAFLLDQLLQTLEAQQEGKELIPLIDSYCQKNLKIEPSRISTVLTY
ncbi:hypothetical protein POKO110462_13355 [Pontibacter korlensis]|uniref:Uncharacterized protein n=1 Tax=Pontibacter korlensis TaxID=400092 RepID=A0A0E3ZFH8_9BACT|nr:hypothetical protein [Pontibacter korlensis]AKD04288.1 hypothetical protein PKOR_15825 [Pontibacter korlensis]